MEIRELYDQVSAETEHDAILSSEPIKYKDNIYYVEITFNDYAIANSNKKYQFALGTYAWGNSWNTSDDWSHTGIKQETDAFTGTVEKTDYICVYDNGVLVGGTEPDGTTPADVTTTTTTDTSQDTTTTSTSEDTNVTTTTTFQEDTTTTDSSVSTSDSQTETSTTSQVTDTLLGDVNCDQKVSTADLLALKKHLLGISELSGQGLINADINQDEKVSTADLLALKKHLLGIEPIA